ncbi:MAG: hypothetical protein M1825_003090 [Sarcosagium campestre]|nr:MAG: hypothetical protein M1825_003090 [Sarcosagium campestre]
MAAELCLRRQPSSAALTTKTLPHLPQEIREMIYRDALIVGKIFLGHDLHKIRGICADYKKPNLNLLCVSKSDSLADHLFYSCNTFVCPPGDGELFREYLQSLSIEKYTRIRSVELHFSYNDLNFDYCRRHTLVEEGLLQALQEEADIQQTIDDETANTPPEQMPHPHPWAADLTQLECRLRRHHKIHAKLSTALQDIWWRKCEAIAAMNLDSLTLDLRDAFCGSDCQCSEAVELVTSLPSLISRGYLTVDFILNEDQESSREKIETAFWNHQPTY